MSNSQKDLKYQKRCSMSKSKTWSMEVHKKQNKEAIWLYAELFSVITITDSHDKIYTTSGLFFPIQPKVW